MGKYAIVVFIELASLSAGTAQAQSPNTTRIECEVLEVSDQYRGNRKELAATGYALVRHKNPADRQRMSRWLRTESGAEVVFTVSDGIQRHGVLRRVRMCFGRGLLLFAEPVKLKDRETLVIDLSAASMRSR